MVVVVVIGWINNTNTTFILPTCVSFKFQLSLSPIVSLFSYAEFYFCVTCRLSSLYFFASSKSVAHSVLYNTKEDLFIAVCYSTCLDKAKEFELIGLLFLQRSLLLAVYE